MATTNAPKSATATSDRVGHLNRDEGWELLEREAQQALQMSARDFIEAWRSGKYDDPDEHPEAFSLAMLLPFVGEDPWSGRPSSAFCH